MAFILRIEESIVFKVSNEIERQQWSMFFYKRLNHEGSLRRSMKRRRWSIYIFYCCQNHLKWKSQLCGIRWRLQRNPRNIIEAFRMEKSSRSSTRKWFKQFCSGAVLDYHCPWMTFIQILLLRKIHVKQFVILQKNFKSSRNMTATFCFINAHVF